MVISSRFDRTCLTLVQNFICLLCALWITSGKEDMVLAGSSKNDFLTEYSGYGIIFSPNEEVALLGLHLNIIIIYFAYLNQSATNDIEK